MKDSRFVLIIMVISWIFWGVSCASDQLEPGMACETMTPTYSSTIKPIIDQTCAYSGCHDGAGGIGPGNYTTYDGIEPDLQSGNFADRVINLRENPSRGMPPNESVYPESQQDDLSDIQMEILRCWIQNGYPQ